MAKKKSRIKYSAINIATSFGGQLLSTVLNFVVRTVFIQTLGKSYLGINGLFSNILTMLSLTELGLDTAINFKLYKPLAEGDEKRVRVLMKFYKQAYRVIGVVIFILGLFMIPLLPFLIKDYESLKVLGINAVLIFLLHVLRSVSSYLFFAYRSAVLKADQRKYITDIAGFGITILTSLVKIIVLYVWKDFVLYTATVIVFNILQNLVNAFLAKHFYPNVFVKDEDKITKEEVIGLIKDCGALFVFKLNAVVLKVTDNLVISSFIGIAAVGLYSNYTLLYNTLRSLFNKMFSSIKASVGNLFVTETIDRRYQFFQSMNYLSIILFGTAGVGIAVCSNELILAWIGDEYIIPQPFSILIGIEILFYGLKLNLNQIRNVSGVFRQMWFRPVLGVIINIIVSISLVFICGIYGVIIGTIVADVISNFMVDPRVIYKYSFNDYRPVSEYYKKNITYMFILCVIGAVDLLICNNLFVGHGWLSVIIHASITGISVPGILTLIYWKTPENDYIISTMKRVIRKGKKRRERQ